MKLIVYLAIAVALFILFAGYPLSAIQNSIPPTDGTGEFDNKHAVEKELTEQDYKDTMDKVYPSTPTPKKYTTKSQERYEG